MTRSILNRLIIATLCMALLILVWANRTGRLQSEEYKNKGTLLPVTSSTVWSPKVKTISLGVYVEKVYDFTVQSQAFSAEGWAWLTWGQDFQEEIDARKIPISNIITVLNLEQTTNFSFVPANDSPTKLPDGRYLQPFKFYGKFYARGLDFRRFPFNSIALPITFSLNPEIPFLDSDNVRLIPDKIQSGLGEFTNVPGYLLSGCEASEAIYHFQSHLGMPGEFRGSSSSYSRVVMEIFYESSILAALLQLFLPLVVIMAVVLLAPNLAGSLWDVRLALPSTALLTLIFLQQGYRAQLPLLPYLTFIDQVYALCYATSLAIFALFVWSSNRLDQASEADRPAVIEEINRIDRRFQTTLTAGLLLLITLSWLVPVR